MGYVGNDLFVDSSEDIEIYNTKITAKKDDSGYFRMYSGGRRKQNHIRIIL